MAFGGTVHNAIYNFSTGTWTATTDFPNGNDMADAPCAVLPNGDVLVATSPGIFQTPVTFFTFDGTTFTQAPPTQTSASLTSYQERFLLLPTGQVLSVVADGIAHRCRTLYMHRGDLILRGGLILLRCRPRLLVAQPCRSQALSSTGFQSGPIMGTIALMPRTIRLCVLPMRLQARVLCSHPRPQHDGYSYR